MGGHLGRVQGRRLKHRRTRDGGRGERQSRAWSTFAVPGGVWLAVFFLLPLYVTACVAFGPSDLLLGIPRPEWSPLRWTGESLDHVLAETLATDGIFGRVFLRTAGYIAAAVVVSLAIAYPVAYYVSRFGGRFRGLLLAGLVAPFFISYLMRMLAWINLLQDDGWVNDVLRAVGILDAPYAWLDGRASSVVIGLVYGYVPFLILPLYAFLDRIDPALVEAARDLGASPAQAFRRVTLPLSVPAVMTGVTLIALPMFGDYYTTDLLSGSPKTSMIGNQVNLYIRGGGQVNVGAALVIVLMLVLSVLMAYYLVATARAQRRVSGTS